VACDGGGHARERVRAVGSHGELVGGDVGVVEHEVAKANVELLWVGLDERAGGFCGVVEGESDGARVGVLDDVDVAGGYELHGVEE
jgi:hypothetical protein